MQRRFSLLICLLISLTTITAQKKALNKNVRISGHITETSDYCGGAMPSEEKLRLLKTPQPLFQKAIYIKTGSKNIASATVIKKVITDENGDFTVVLKSGTTYCFLEEWKSKPLQIPEDTEYTKWDPQCFRDRYNTPDFILKVKNTGNPVVSINYHTPCFFRPYCGVYSGPLPP